MTYLQNEKSLNSNKGLFISLEGPEGAGKSTQVAMLTEWLIGFGLKVFATREPGDGRIGGQIRKIILDPENQELTPTAEALLYCADRAQHVEKTVKPALEAGFIVVCDRYVDSHIAYQGYGRGLDLDFLATLNQMATGGLMPHLTLLLELPPQLGLERIKRRESKIKSYMERNPKDLDRIEQEVLAFHERVSEGYRKIAQEQQSRVQVINGAKELTAIQEELQQIVSGVLIQRGFILRSKRDTEIFD